MTQASKLAVIFSSYSFPYLGSSIPTVYPEISRIMSSFRFVSEAYLLATANSNKVFWVTENSRAQATTFKMTFHHIMHSPASAIHISLRLAFATHHFSLTMTSW